VRVPLVAHLLALVLALPVLAQSPAAPQVSVALDPEGPVTVGTTVEVSVTLLVPTFMPEPPVWPELQIADAITRLPERATRPVTERIGQESWSGVTRSWEIIPQRAADYDLSGAEISATYADPTTNAPTEATVPLPTIAFSATVPPGAEGMDPFLPASRVTVTATVDGLPAAPKPGDAFTLTLVTAADGPPAMLLPPLAERLPSFPGLRAYPRQPVLADGPTATRTEAVAYVIEAPGRFAFPALALDWWNTAANTRATAATDAIAIDVPAPPGWRTPGQRPARRWLWPALALAALALLAAAFLRRPRSVAPPSEARLYRALCRSIRRDSVGVIHLRLAAWLDARGPVPPADAAAIREALAPLDRQAYGQHAEAVISTPRQPLLAAVRRARKPPRRPGSEMLPPLNPSAT
jgi:hypothetical protein